jgi:hypothetical protein
MSDWRPFEPSREAVQAALEHNRCNLHDDCEAADANVRAGGGRRAQNDGWAGGKFVKRGELVMVAMHCTIEDCEDCFGC